MLKIGGELTGAASTLGGSFIVNLLATEAMKIANKCGVKLPVYFSQNIDGFGNESLYERYEKRIKHLWFIIPFFKVFSFDISFIDIQKHFKFIYPVV